MSNTGTKTLRGNCTIWLAKPEAFGSQATWEAPLSAATFAAALTAGLIINASVAIEDAYKIDTTGASTDSSQSVADTSVVQSPLFQQYEIDFQIFRNTPGTTDTPQYDQVLSWIDGADCELYAIVRVDKTQGAAVAAGDILSTFGFKTDYLIDVIAENSMLMANQVGKPTGVLGTNLTAVA